MLKMNFLIEVDIHTFAHLFFSAWGALRPRTECCQLTIDWTRLHITRSGLIGRTQATFILPIVVIKTHQPSKVEPVLMYVYLPG